MKTGLVMEGGAMRGLFTAGVIDVLMENGIEFDGAVGVSAGAAFGCNYKSKQIGRVLRYNLDYCKDPRYCSFRSLVKTGDLFGAEFCYRVIPEKLDVFDYEQFNGNPMEFHVVCTDVHTGRAVYKAFRNTDEDLLEWIRASASMPMASRIVEVGGYQLLDGGISDSIPLKYFEAQGYDKNVVILTRPKAYVKGPNKLMPIMKKVLRKYPGLIDVMNRRHEEYNETVEYIKQREEEGAAFVIRPERPLDIGKIEHDPDKIKGAYEAGRSEGMKTLEAVKQFLAQ
ncbi:MAG: patatin family protein [Bacillota bacterium]|nr:patatin family protein [Bacillota bacterium]